MARLTYECSPELKSTNLNNQSQVLKPFACTADKYCLYCCCNSQCCLLLHRRPPKYFWEAWYFWLGVALLILFIISSISSYVISNCHNLHIMTISHNRSTRSSNDNRPTQQIFSGNANGISIHVIPTTRVMSPTNNSKMLLSPPQLSASHMTPIVA